MAVSGAEIIYYKSLAVAGDGTPSCGGGIDVASEVASTLHDLFDVITAAEANGSNKDEYRLIYIKNTNATDTLFSSVLDVSSDSTSPATVISVGLDPTGVNVNSTITLVDEEDSTNLLTAVTFVTTGSTIAIGDVTNNDLANTQIRAVWIKRALTTPAASIPADTVQLRVTGETA